jgi:hypothetical protein
VCEDCLGGVALHSLAKGSQTVQHGLVFSVKCCAEMIPLMIDSLAIIV